MARTAGFDGIDMGTYLTFSQGATPFTKGTHENWPAKVSANGAVSRAASTDQFLGIARIIDSNGDVMVQYQGFCTVTQGTGTFAVGPLTLEADGAGKVNVVVAAAGKKVYYCVSVNGTTDAVIKL